jgi:predicted dehydrogenase
MRTGAGPLDKAASIPTSLNSETRRRDVSNLRIALVGFGYWGPNVARNLQSLPDVTLTAIADPSPNRRAEASRRFPSAGIVSSLDGALEGDAVDALVVATPAHTHFGLAKRALEAGCHVLVEKPLATTVDDCDQLGELAARCDRTLMVGHTFLYNPAVRRLREYICSGDLGEVLYVYTQRLNLGRVRDDVNVLWNLAPHDLSILLYLLDETPVAVTAQGRGYVRADVEDVAFVGLEFAGGCLGHLHVSWLDPRKVRQVTVVGTRKMIVYDDVDVEARLRVYDKGIDVVPSPEDATGRTHESLGEFQALVRSGDLLVPRIDFREPLQIECEEFVAAIRERRAPLTDVAHARAVVSVLAATDTSLRSGGVRVEVTS